MGFRRLCRQPENLVLKGTCQHRARARGAVQRWCWSCRRCRRVSTLATAPAFSPAVLPPPCSRLEKLRVGRSLCPYHHAGRWSPRAPRCCLRSSDELTLLPPVILCFAEEDRSLSPLREFQCRT